MKCCSFQIFDFFVEHCWVPLEKMARMAKKTWFWGKKFASDEKWSKHLETGAKVYRKDMGLFTWIFSAFFIALAERGKQKKISNRHSSKTKTISEKKFLNMYFDEYFSLKIVWNFFKWWHVLKISKNRQEWRAFALFRP